jgi:hypothetical protein
LFKILFFFTYYIVFYNYSKLEIYTITFLNQVKQFKNYAKK